MHHCTWVWPLNNIDHKNTHPIYIFVFLSSNSVSAFINRLSQILSVYIYIYLGSYCTAPSLYNIGPAFPYGLQYFYCTWAIALRPSRISLLVTIYHFNSTINRNYYKNYDIIKLALNLIRIFLIYA